jgi:hypothetical protein
MENFVKKILTFTLVILVLVSGFFIFTYLTDEENIVFPLETGTNYIYSGNYVVRGSDRTIKMDAPEHRIVIEREFLQNNEKCWIFSLRVTDSLLHSFILSKNNEGVFLITGGTKTLIIPAQVKRGQEWNFDVGSVTITGKAGGRKKIKTARGIYNAREIFFQSNTRTRIKIWLHPEAGIVAFDYSYINDASSRNEALMILNDIKIDK